MNYLSLAALVHTHKDGPRIPGEWLEERLTRHLGGYGSGGSDESATRAWAVGAVHGTEPLVQARPIVRDPATRFSEDFLRAPSQCTIAGFTTADASTRPPRFGITRFHRWIAIRGEAELSPSQGDDALRELQARLRAELPPFIRRSLIDGSDRELVAMAVISRLHTATAMGKTYADPELIREALREIDGLLDRPPQIHLLVSDGRSVGVLHRGGQAVALRPPKPAGQRLGVQRPPRDHEHDLLLLFNCGDGPRSPILDDEAAPLEDGVFTVSARHPVRIDRE